MALFNKKSAAPQQKSADFALLPNHVGIIMDGNGRWAKKRGLPRSAGHKAGAEVFRTISKACGRIGIPYVTFYAFSTENWKRSPEEVDALMRLFKDYLLEAQADISQAGNIRLKFIGSREGISDELLRLMDQGERDTAANTGTTVYVAINYGGRQEIVHRGGAQKRRRAVDGHGIGTAHAMTARITEGKRRIDDGNYGSQRFRENNIIKLYCYGH